MRRAQRWCVPGLAALLLSGAALSVGTPAMAQEVTIPPGVTRESVRAGFDLYHGKGACGQCHGDFGLGSPEGPALTGGQWKLGSGTIEFLVHITRHAGWGATSRDGDPAPMRGPTVLDSAEVAAVASYVWSISRGRAVRPSP
jgi:mono/diheme cytochrome c family protein